MLTAGAAMTAALAVLAPAAQASAAPSWAAGSPSAVRLARTTWWGGAYGTQTGESVRVYLSTGYTDDGVVAQGWADFFASLIHGPELSALTVFLAPPSEVAELCGSDRSLGCYSNQRLVAVGDSSAGVPPTAVASHEYGHHVANNRVNPPWRALDWGTKRWASQIGVCARTADGAFHPGDEDGFYALNPAEGFAESYRVLNESRAGASTFSWPIVDQTFFPEAAALSAIEEDVLRPWSAPTVTTLSGRFATPGARVWKRTIPTPLDGDLTVALGLPAAAAYDVDLLASDGRTVLGRGLWSGAAEKTLRYTICGERSVKLRVTRRGPAGVFRAEVSRP
jgi:hypothetical protein